jgi:hypothetical protein
MSMTDLHVEIHPVDTTVIVQKFEGQVIDLNGISPPVVIHQSDPFKIRATITLAGPFSKIMCGELGVQLNIESVGSPTELEVGPKWQDLDPCGTGVYVFDFDFAAGSLPGKGVGTPYVVVFTFATKQCGTVGAIHGHAGTLHFSIHP